MESQPRPIDDVDLCSYHTFLQVESEGKMFPNPRDFIDDLLHKQRERPFVTDALVAMANIIEPRLLDGTRVDPAKNISKALLAGGLLASAFIDAAGAGYVLDNLELRFPTTIVDADISPERLREQHAGEIQNIGADTYFDYHYSMHRALIENIQKELVPPRYQPALHVGFGFMMYLADQEITRLQQRQRMAKALEAFQDPQFNLDAALEAFFYPTPPEAE
jgi:hypothetical protein